MLRITDSLRLAGTKLRVRRIRLSITVVVSGLLFAALLAGPTMLMGAKQSVEEFDRGSLNNRKVCASHAPERGRMDLRSYGVGAQILRELGVRRMQLLGMPRRLPSMAGGFGLEVTGHLSPQQEPQAQG